ncbi:SDR family NAD(P)-dependent oxidoreductase [bacterium]|nr:SDR family NAD(P)-dependent oxidoreductase [bacterium]
MSWGGKKVLVTGAGGFIGSHLAEMLVESGAEVRAMVHYNALGSRGWLDRSTLADQMEIVAGDVADRDSVAQATAGREVVFHLAALIGIPYSYAAPASYVRTNIEGTLNVLNAARQQGRTRVVHTSTSEVYGTAQYVPMDEAHPLQGQSPYSASKIGADKMAEAYHRSFEVPVVTVRPFNTYGPRQSARAVIPTIISQALTRDEIRLGDATPLRDMNFVADTVRGFLAAGEADGAIGEVINLGSGHEVAIGDLAKLILELIGKEIPIVSDPARLRPEGSEVSRLCAQNEKAKRLLHWEPQTDLRAGLAVTIAWIREHPEYFRPDDYTT